MKKIYLLWFITVVMFSCTAEKELVLSDLKSIMVQNQYKEVGFESPEILYNSDSSLVLVKKTLKKEKPPKTLINYFVLELSTNQIIFQGKFWGSNIKWISKEVIEIKAYKNQNSLTEKLYRINFKTNSRENVRLTSD